MLMWVWVGKDSLAPSIRRSNIPNDVIEAVGVVEGLGGSG